MQTAENIASEPEAALRLSAVPKHLDDELVAKSLEFIWSQQAGAISVSDVARQMCVTRKTLNRRFTDALGQSVRAEIMRSRMLRAEYLLKTTTLQVKRVAYRAGFTSSERMRVAFLEQHDVSPSEYRAQHRCSE